MRQYVSQAVVLRRVDYGEADRIITFITPSHGKISAIAKGVRKNKSKLAGGIELFSESSITFGKGKGDLEMVFSSRLDHFYGNIMTDYDRLAFGYETIRMINKTTEDLVGPEFYQLLKKGFFYLDNLDIDYRLTEIWFRLQIEKELGRSPSLEEDANGEKLQVDKRYAYDPIQQGLYEYEHGPLTSDHIKFLRLAREHSPGVLAKVVYADLLRECLGFAVGLSV
jgi:DNA repair protein RecO (recombination protein O)